MAVNIIGGDGRVDLGQAGFLGGGAGGFEQGFANPAPCGMRADMGADHAPARLDAKGIAVGRAFEHLKTQDRPIHILGHHALDVDRIIDVIVLHKGRIIGQGSLAQGRQFFEIRTDFERVGANRVSDFHGTLNVWRV